MVLISLVRVSAKAAIVASTIYVTHKHGVWGGAEEGHKVANKVSGIAKEVLSQTGTPIGEVIKTKSGLSDAVDNNSSAVSLAVPFSSCDSVRDHAKLSWNSMVDSSVDVLRNTPQLIAVSLQTLLRWVRFATAPEDKR